MRPSLHTRYKTVRRAVVLFLCVGILFGSTAAIGGGIVATAEGRVGSDNSGDASGFLLAVSALSLTIAAFAWTTKTGRDEAGKGLSSALYQ